LFCLFVRWLLAGYYKGRKATTTGHLLARELAQLNQSIFFLCNPHRNCFIVRWKLFFLPPLGSISFVLDHRSRLLWAATRKKWGKGGNDSRECLWWMRERNRSFEVGCNASCRNRWCNFVEHNSFVVVPVFSLLFVSTFNLYFSLKFSTI
jgi:hypothetical protein